jgi:hypothetical protein
LKNHQIIHSRKPPRLKFAIKIAEFEENQNSLPPDLRLLIKIAAATENGCSFCQNIALAYAVKGKIGTSKVTTLINGEDANDFTKKNVPF